MKFEDDRISFDFDNPGSSSTGSGGGEEKPFYEELDDAMADEFVAYEEHDMQEQALVDQLLGDSFLLDE